jgi:hypothetical protein
MKSATVLTAIRKSKQVARAVDIDNAVAAFNSLCACPIPNASRLAPQAR